MTSPEQAKAPTRRIERGDVFWLCEPQAPPSPPHPYVVVQDDVFNRSRIDTVVVCAVTSNLQRASEPGNVLLDLGEGNLPRRSVLVVSQVASVKKAELGEYIGRLRAERVEQVLDGLRFQQASFFRERA
jgi:mRNA interferase MazF